MVASSPQGARVLLKGDCPPLPKPPRNRGRAASEVELCGEVAVDVEAEGFFQEGFGDAEIVGQIP